MPTTVVKSIGTNSRDYSTLQSWEDACPANLVSADQIWKGECYNDSEFTAGVTISGQTTDSTRYVWLTAAAGHSFKDHANVRTNALAYNVSNGVGVHWDASGNGSTVDVTAAHTRIDRLQIKRSGGGNYSVTRAAALLQSRIDSCIVDFSVATNGVFRYALYLNNAVASNCVVVCRNETRGIYLSEASSAINCTVIAITVSNLGVTAAYSGTAGLGLRNCALFGFSTAPDGTFDADSDYNATDLSSGLPGANSLHSCSFAACFENTATDFRLKAGSPLIDAGNTDATYAPNDISGTARGSGLDGDIGAWEYTSGGGGGGGVIEPFIRARRPGVTWINDRGA